MIQKIRSYLLDNEDHKDFIGWYVVIIMLFPVIGMIFQYRKSVVNSVGKINGKEIEKSIFNIKLFEQSKLMENITKMFGEEQSSYFFDMLFQGKSVEQFVLSLEMKRVFLEGRFEKLISKDPISSEYINFNLKRKSLDVIKNNIGELPFLLVSGQLKPSLLGSMQVDMKKIDRYCEEVFQVNLLKNIFLVPLSTIEKLVFKNYTGLPLKINFLVYSFSLKKNIDQYKKRVDIKTIGENEIKYVYDSGVKKGDYQKPRNIRFMISSYALKEEKDKKTKDKKDKIVSIEDMNKKIQEKYDFIKNEIKNIADLTDLIKFLDKDFNCKESNKEIMISVKNDRNVVSCSTTLSDELKEKIVLSIMRNEKKDIDLRDKFIVLVENGYLFLVEGVDVSLIDYKSMNEVRDAIVESIVLKRARDLINLDMEKMRYDLEKKESVNMAFWDKEEKSFIQNNEKNENGKYFYDLINKKLYAGGLREGSTFFDFKDEDTYYVYSVSGITYEVENKFVVRKDQFYNREVFIDSIERLAKIEIND